MDLLKSNKFSLFINLVMSLFFITILSFKGGHNFSPILLMVVALGYLIYFVKNKQTYSIDKDEKALIISYIFYFALFILSILVNGGKLKELDNPSRLIFLIPLLLLFFQYPIRFKVLAYSIPMGAAISGIVALYDRFYLHLPRAYSVRTMPIQGGDIAMSLGMFSLVIALYFIYKRQYKLTTFCMIATLLGMLGSFLSASRGGWIGLPFVVIFILFTYRKYLSKQVLSAISLVIIISITGVFLSPKTQLIKRVNQAEKEVMGYFENNRGNSSLGARLDMWKSAVLMIEEKPILGWGQQGSIDKRKQQAKEKIIHPLAGSFDHAHNQYLDDFSKRGIFGFFALLAIFLVPLRFFSKQLKDDSFEVKTVATLGVVHIASVMFYCLSQGFFTHNSGNIFYFFLVIVFYSIIKTLKLKNMS